MVAATSVLLGDDLLRDLALDFGLVLILYFVLALILSSSSTQHAPAFYKNGHIR